MPNACYQEWSKHCHNLRTIHIFTKYLIHITTCGDQCVWSVIYNRFHSHSVWNVFYKCSSSDSSKICMSTLKKKFSIDLYCIIYYENVRNVPAMKATTHLQTATIHLWITGDLLERYFSCWLHLKILMPRIFAASYRTEALRFSTGLRSYWFRIKLGHLYLPGCSIEFSMSSCNFFICLVGYMIIFLFPLTFALKKNK